MAILHPTLLANLMVEVGTRHSHQILLDPSEQTSVKSESKYTNFHSPNKVQNVVCKLAAIWSRPQCVNLADEIRCVFMDILRNMIGLISSSVEFNQLKSEEGVNNVKKDSLVYGGYLKVGPRWRHWNRSFWKTKN